MTANPVSVAFREDERNPGHVKVSVFIGRNPGSRGHSGQITIRTDEWDEMVEQIEIIGHPYQRMEIQDPMKRDDDPIDEDGSLKPFDGAKVMTIGPPPECIPRWFKSLNDAHHASPTSSTWHLLPGAFGPLESL